MGNPFLPTRVLGSNAAESRELPSRLCDSHYLRQSYRCSGLVLNIEIASGSPSTIHHHGTHHTTTALDLCERKSRRTDCSSARVHTPEKCNARRSPHLCVRSSHDKKKTTRNSRPPHRRKLAIRQRTRTVQLPTCHVHQDLRPRSRLDNLPRNKTSNARGHVRSHCKFGPPQSPAL